MSKAKYEVRIHTETIPMLLKPVENCSKLRIEFEGKNLGAELDHDQINVLVKHLQQMQDHYGLQKVSRPQP